MKAVLQTIRFLVVTLLIEAALSQDGFERDLLRLHRLASEGSSDSLNGYGSGLLQRDQSPRDVPVSAHYHLNNEDKNEEYDRRGRSRKVYRIKNPFQHQDNEPQQQQETQTGSQDNDGGASNQYAAMQYSLPPEEFLRQMRAENQYYQQQQVSSPAPSISYTATPQPQYQYSTIAPSGYDTNSPQNNQVPQLEPKMSQLQDYRSIANSYQYSGPNSYVESVQSTPSPIPPYLSTSNNQYVGTPSSTYVSSSSPLYLSSPANVQFMSSSISAIPAGTPDYNNKVTSTLGSNSLSYEVEMNKKMQIDHYDNAANGIRYPTSIQQQFQNEYPSSTPAPSSTQYPDPLRDAWQNNINSNAKSLQEYSQYPKYSYYQKPQDSRTDQVDGDTHRIGNMPAANNVYLNFAQPDFQTLSNLRSRTRESEQEQGQSEIYSHGDYGWKLSDRKPLATQSQSAYTSVNFPRYQQPLTSQGDGVAVSQMSFHMDTGKPQQNYEHISKSSSDTADAQEFAKAAARAHENMKRQQYFANEYQSSFITNSPVGSSTAGSSYYGTLNDRQRGKMYSDTSSPNSYLYNNGQPDVITAPPYYYPNPRENVDDKPKQPFDHDRALKNIVPIDVSNVVQESQHKLPQGYDSNRYNLQSFNKEQEQALKQSFKSITDQFYQDKNSAYGLNIKPRPEDGISSDTFKLLESPSQYYTKSSPQEQYFGQAYAEQNKRYIDSSSSSANYVPQQSGSFSGSLQSPANVQQPGLQRPQSQAPTDIGSILKLNDIPYRLTQNLPSETFRLNTGNYEPVGLPTPLPIRLNQNVGSHQIDVASSILNKLMQNKPTPLRPELDPSVLSTVNGFKIANPYNVDLKLVADMLKGKPGIDDSHMVGLRDQYIKNSPLKFDLSQLQQILLKADNPGGLAQLDGIGAYSSPFLDIYGSGRYPYTGVKYSRSQEEEETVIPIADSSNNHPIGAVVEQDDPINPREINNELAEPEDDGATGGVEIKFNEDRQKHTFGPRHKPDRHRHPNSLLPARHGYLRKYPKGETRAPYSLLKPPPTHGPRVRVTHNSHKPDRHSSRRRRPRRQRVVHVTKTEHNFENEPDDNSEGVSFLLRPPPPIADAKSDKELSEPEPSS